MASFVLRNSTEDDGRDGDPTDLGGIAVRRDGTALDDAVNGSRRSRLDLVIESEIIPRLMVAHSMSLGTTPEAVSLPEDTALETEKLDSFVDLILTGDVHAAAAHIEALRETGSSLDTILLELLAPAARRLGENWEEDTVTFAEVTVGLSRLQQLLREIAPGGPGRADAKPHGHRVLLASVPGDQHTFGVFMVEEFFRRAGWDVVTCVLETSEDLMALVGTESFSVVGFSISRDELFEELVSNIQKIYKVSKNKNVRILVGGRCIMDIPQRFGETGADGMARDGREAVTLANSLVGLAAPR